MSHLIYRIHFPGADKTYIGFTRQSMQQRMAAHKNRKNAVNPKLYHLLSSDAGHTITVLERGIATRAEARQREEEYLLAEDRDTLLNTYIPNPNKPRIKRKKPDTYKVKKQWRCSLCGKHKPPQAYYGDSTRYNGLASRCKVCCIRARQWRNLGKYELFVALMKLNRGVK